MRIGRSESDDAGFYLELEINDTEGPTDLEAVPEEYRPDATAGIAAGVSALTHVGIAVGQIKVLRVSIRPPIDERVLKNDYFASSAFAVVKAYYNEVQEKKAGQVILDRLKSATESVCDCVNCTKRRNETEGRVWN